MPKTAELTKTTVDPSTEHIETQTLSKKKKFTNNVNELVKKIREYIDSVPEIGGSTLPNSDTPEALDAVNGMQELAIQQISKELIGSLNLARDNEFGKAEQAGQAEVTDAIKVEQSVEDTVGGKHPALYQALVATAQLAMLVQEAYELEFKDSVDPDALRKEEAQDRYDLVMEMLQRNLGETALSAYLPEQAEKEPIYASPKWFKDFLESHPELSELDKSEKPGDAYYKIYAQSGAGNITETKELIDELPGSERYEFKKQLAIREATANPTMDVEKVMESVGVSGYDKYYVRKAVVIGRAIADPTMDVEEAMVSVGVVDEDAKDYVKQEVVIGRAIADPTMDVEEAMVSVGVVDYDKDHVRKAVAVGRAGLLRSPEKTAKVLTNHFGELVAA